MDSKLGMSQSCVLAAKRSTASPAVRARAEPGDAGEEYSPRAATHLPVARYCLQFWSLHYRKDHKMEQVEGSATRMVGVGALAW